MLAKCYVTAFVNIYNFSKIEATEGKGKDLQTKVTLGYLYGYGHFGNKLR